MQKIILSAIVFLLLVPQFAVNVPTGAAKAGEAWELIAEVNALRASYGLPPYEVDNSLMSAAQRHSEYQASIGTWTHTGPGGSRPHDRAVAAGYGGGAQVYVSENVALGVNLSPQDTVYSMWQDAIHLETMISPNYRHIGAGVATSGDNVYYTIDVGYIAGDPGPKGPTQEVPPGPGGTPAPTAIAMIPILVATPKPDGSIIHVVQYGQFLINIAKAYDVPLKDILALNYLSQNTVIFPGDKLLIKPSGTPNITPQATATGQATPTGAKKPTPTASPAAKRPTPDPTLEPTTPVAIALAPQNGPPPAADLPSGSIVSAPTGGPDYLLIVVFILAVAGSALVALGTALKRIA